ncbi:MAG: ATP-dependent Clp protease proteolytic subunit [Phycisphaerales bacterium]|nr:ATP-dependent Clp protease proteolytic subunit [Phycisphaerales bacterium]
MSRFIYNLFVQVDFLSRVTEWWRCAGKTARSVCLMLLTLGLGAWQSTAVEGQTPVAVPGARQADVVAVITIDGPIDGVTSYSVQRRIRQAAEGGAQAIVFEINSPGGELGAVLEVSQAIKQSPVPNTVAWVRPQAYSGGAIIALAAREIVVSPSAQMGDAFPVTPVAKEGGSTGLRGLTPDERTKLLPPLLADVVDSARRAGYDEYLVQAIVTDGVELWLVEEEGTGRRFAVNQDEYRAVFGRDPTRGSPMFAHVSGGRAQAAAPQTPPDATSSPSGHEHQQFKPASPQLAELSRAVTDRLTVESERPVFDASQAGQWREVAYLTDGSAPIVMSGEQMRTLGFAAAQVGTDEELRQFFGARQLVRVHQSWSETASGFLSQMPVRFVLIAVFLLALFIEMSSPGLILPGAIALLSGFLLLAPPMIIGMATWWEIGAIGLGVVLIALEIFVLPGFGIFGVIGLVALFGGLVGTFIPNQGLLPDASHTGDALRGIVTILLALMTAGVGMYFISKHFQTLPLLSRLVLTDRRDEEEDLSLKEMLGPEPTFAVKVGVVGVATTNLKPVGQAEFGDRIVDVMSDLAFVRSGTPVRVVSVSATRVVVEPVEGTSA